MYFSVNRSAYPIELPGPASQNLIVQMRRRLKAYADTATRLPRGYRVALIFADPTGRAQPGTHPKQPCGGAHCKVIVCAWTHQVHCRRASLAHSKNSRPWLPMNYGLVVPSDPVDQCAVWRHHRVGGPVSDAGDLCPPRRHGRWRAADGGLMSYGNGWAEQSGHHPKPLRLDASTTDTN